MWGSFHVDALVGFVRIPRERHQPPWDAKVWIQEHVDTGVAPVGWGWVLAAETLGLSWKRVHMTSKVQWPCIREALVMVTGAGSLPVSVTNPDPIEQLFSRADLSHALPPRSSPLKMRPALPSTDLARRLALLLERDRASWGRDLHPQLSLSCPQATSPRPRGSTSSVEDLTSRLQV